jgi:adenylosuccinate lyase
MPLDPLTGISSIDGRYREAAQELTEYFSEFALIRARVRVECEYIIALSETKGAGIRELTATEKKILQKISDISLEDELLSRVVYAGLTRRFVPPVGHP